MTLWWAEKCLVIIIGFGLLWLWTEWDRKRFDK